MATIRWLYRAHGASVLHQSYTGVLYYLVSFVTDDDTVIRTQSRQTLRMTTAGDPTAGLNVMQRFYRSHMSSVLPAHSVYIKAQIKACQNLHVQKMLIKLVPYRQPA